MLFAMSDIHGCFDAFINRIHDLNDLETVKAGKDKLILLGDYIDRGSESYKVLQKSTTYSRSAALIKSLSYGVIMKNGSWNFWKRKTGTGLEKMRTLIPAGPF